MEHLQQLNELIDRAKAIAGSDYALSKSIGVSRQRISNWRHGHVPCPVEDQALIAAAAGLDPTEFLVRAVVQKHEGTEKGDRLMRVLGKSSLAIGVALAGVGAHAQAIFSTIQTTGGLDTLRALWEAMCIM